MANGFALVVYSMEGNHNVDEVKWDNYGGFDSPMLFLMKFCWVFVGT